MSFFRLEYPWLLLIAVPVVILVVCYRLWLYKSVVYRHSLASTIKKIAHHNNQYKKYFLNVMRFIALALCAFIVAKPQMVDQTSKVWVDGIDIMMVLDVSGSMSLFDDLHDARPRIDVAKQEALNFIDKRDNDQIGLILFGADAVSRCPLTLDKKILKQIINDIQLGVINHQGTVLSIAMAQGINRLKNAHAKSKIMIVLTDGEPTPGDLEPKVVLDMAKKYGIKIYTIGIGSEKGGYIVDQIFGPRHVPQKLNKPLLMTLAQETGGRFFEAQRPDDIKAIYDTIDKLEKTEYETTLFSKYYDIFIPFLWIVLALLSLEIVLSTLVWFCV
jgi:Ca-activated chloride channel family protein